MPKRPAAKTEGFSPSTAALDARLAEILDRQQRQWAAGCPVTVEQLLAGRDTDCEDRLELVYNELILRERAGETPALEEYQRRFPDLAEALRIQWEVDRALVEGLTARSEQEPGSSIGRYEIHEELGRGSSGIVYRAVDPRLNRVVALKRLRAGFDARPEDTFRLRAEAESIAQLKHDNIVQIYDVGETAEGPYFALEYCPGGSLAARLAGQPLEPVEAARLVQRLAEGIAAAHARQIIHRDLKPANVLLGAAGALEPKITDFGLAKWLDADRGLTTTGTVVGTPAYMAPEQAGGGLSPIGPAVDIYALGAILYECLTGRPPFQGATIVDTLEQVRLQEPVGVRRLQPRVPADLETIALCCLQKDPAQRYQTAQALADDLAAFREGQPIRARPVSGWERSWRWCHRNPRVAGLLGAVAALLVTIAVGSTAAAAWLKQERDAAKHAESRAIDSDQQHRQELYHAYLLEVQSSRLIGAAGQRERGLKAIRSILHSLPPNELSAAQLGQLRDEALASLALADIRTERTLPDWCRSSALFDADIDDTLHWFVAGDEKSATTLIGSSNAETPEWRVDRTTAPDSLSDYHLAFSPNGRWALSVAIHGSSQGQTRVWDRESQSWSVERSYGFIADCFAFHPTEPEVILADVKGGLHAVNLISGEEIRQSPARFPFARIAYSPDGRLLAVASRTQPAEIIDVRTWKTVVSLPDAGRTNAVAWSAANDRVLFGGLDGRVYCHEPANRRGHFLARQHASAIDAVHVSPDGKLLATSFADRSVTITRLMGEQTLLSLEGRALRFSRDSRRMAVAQARGITVQELVSGNALRFDHCPAKGVQFSPDGQWLATGGPNCARILSAGTLEPLCLLNLDPSGPLSFHPNGRELVSFGIFSHIWKWPLTQSNSDRGRHWQIGPATPVVLPREPGLMAAASLDPQYQGRHAAWSLDGRLFAAADYRHGRVLLADDPAQPLRVFAGLLNAAQVAISPDNAWIAAGAHRFFHVRVWSAHDAHVVLDLPHASQVAFSPDGRWFAAGSHHDVKLYRTTDWQVERTFVRDSPDSAASPVAFQPGARLLAYSPARGRIRLHDLDADRAVATLTDPGNRSLACLAFAPEGSRLAFAGQDWDVGVWDLHELHQGLLDLGLPADGLPTRTTPLEEREDQFTIAWSPQLSPPEQWAKNWLRMANWEFSQGNIADAVAHMTQALEQLRIDATDRERADLLAARGSYQLANQNAAAARDDLEAAVKLQPRLLEPVRQLARLYLLGPPECRAPSRAMGLLASLPEDDEDRELKLLLAIARARLENWQAAKAEIESIAVEQPDSLAAFFLAMAAHHLKDAAGAQRLLDAAQAEYVRRRPDLPPQRQRECDAIASEAAALLQSGAALPGAGAARAGFHRC